MKWTPFNGLGYTPYVTGILNGMYQANLMLMPFASFVVSLFDPIIGLIWFIMWAVAMSVINFWR